MQQARFIADAVPDQHSEIARYWSREGAKLLAPLLHAAALDRKTMGEIVTWLDSQATHGPLETLKAATAHAALLQLEGVLDETANIAPMRSLGRRLAGSAEHGVRVATVWQDLAQMEERFGRPGADNVLGNSVTKCFLGPITDRATRDYVTALLDHSATAHRHNDDYELRRHKASAQRLQQLAAGRALVVNQRDLPAVVRVPFWWERSDLPTADSQVPGKRGWRPRKLRSTRLRAADTELQREASRRR